jgi:protein-tyrosine kinase
MSLVEKALRKLQTSVRETPESAPRRPASAREAEKPLPYQSQVPPTEDLDDPQFDPGTRTARVVNIDRNRLQTLGILPPAHQEREIAGQCRAIKRPLIRYAQEAAETDDPLKRTLMIASALPGDGKTFVSFNLAMSLALEMDLRVLLVDADTPKRHLSQALELDSEKGLLDVLGESGPQVEDVILPTDVPRLDVLPVGTRSDTATELVASTKMVATVNRLATLYRRGIVLFDSPPILLTNESRSLAGLLGHILLVVRAGGTPQQAVKDAVEALGEVRRMSVVLNGADYQGAVGYYYGHSYGYGYGEGIPTPAKPADGA